MDALSRLLSLYQLSTTLDIRCHFGAPWLFEQTPPLPGVAPYHLIVAGTARLGSGGHDSVELSAGDIVVFPKGGMFSLSAGETGLAEAPYEIPGSQVVTVMTNNGEGAVTDILCGHFKFDSAQSNVLINALPEIVLVHTDGRLDFSGLAALIAMLRIETETLRPGASAVVSQLSSVLFTLVIRAWLEQAQSVPGLFALFTEQRLQAVMQAILDAPDKPWTLENMASICHMSRASFARIFRDVAGTTPALVLMQMRMTQAAVLLTKYNRSAGAVGEAVGYQSEAAFNRVFKRHFGVGPGQYRRETRLNDD